uniref:Nuclear pore complex protein NUP58 isoform X3 n=1 Tax=Populus alba TaxID=43335 RepID=A0A4U5QRG4_POPAL|nr:nuclear pore complex protein NUP58 isoform X3 [Populus alba]
MKTAYLVDQRRRGDGNDPFLEADRRERARKEAAAKRAHPTLHLPSNSQPSTQGAGFVCKLGNFFQHQTAPQISTATAPAPAPSGNAFSLFNTPSVPSSSMSSSLFATPTTSAPVSTLFGSAATPSLFGSASQAFGASSSAPALGSASTPSLFGSTTPAFGTVAGSGTSFGPTSKPSRPKYRTVRR